MPAAQILSAFLVVVSPTYGNSISEPMTQAACHRLMHEEGAKFDAFARAREAALGEDMKTADRDAAIDEFWSFRIHCVSKTHPDAVMVLGGQGGR